jgi:hypothetical protein
MHEKKRTTITAVAGLAVCLLLLNASLPIQTPAQTVLSPTPIIPFHDRQSPAGGIPTAGETIDDSSDLFPEEKTFHIPLIFNECVESQIEYFTTRGRTIFQAWLNRSARYIPIMKQILREQNLPEDLVYVAMIESGFNPHAVSQKKAVGPWQFMRATAREYGLNTDRWVDERKDPIKSTRAAAAHFKDLYNIFGSWPMALASYNAGMGRMQGAVLRARSDDFWELRASRLMHMETQDYVPKYMAALIIARNPASYGFKDPEAQPFEYEEIIVHTSVHLGKIADYTGRSFKEIQDLNPELLLSTTPKASYVLRIPPGTRELYQMRTAKASATEKKLRTNREKARSGGLLFTRLASAFRPPQSDNVPAPIVFPYAVQLDPSYHFQGSSNQGASAGIPVLRRTDGGNTGLP